MNVRLLVLCTLIGCLSPQFGNAQDSLYQHGPVRQTLGPWSGVDSTRTWCVTRYFEHGGLLDVIEVAVADTTHRPPCRRADGSLMPLFFDAPRCPEPWFQSSPYPFAIVRCGPDQYRLVRRQGDRRAQ